MPAMLNDDDKKRHRAGDGNEMMTKEKQAYDDNRALAMSDDIGDARRYCALAMPTMTMLNESRAGDAMLGDIVPNPCAVPAITMMENDR